MSKLRFMSEVHLNHLLEKALAGDEEAADQIHTEWHLQRERIRLLKQEGRDMTVKDWKAWRSE